MKHKKAIAISILFNSVLLATLAYHHYIFSQGVYRDTGMGYSISIAYPVELSRLIVTSMVVITTCVILQFVFLINNRNVEVIRKAKNLISQNVPISQDIEEIFDYYEPEEIPDGHKIETQRHVRN